MGCEALSKYVRMYVYAHLLLFSIRPYHLHSPFMAQHTLLGTLRQGKRVIPVIKRNFVDKAQTKHAAATLPHTPPHSPTGSLAPYLLLTCSLLAHNLGYKVTWYCRFVANVGEVAK